MIVCQHVCWLFQLLLLLLLLLQVDLTAVVIAGQVHLTLLHCQARISIDPRRRRRLIAFRGRRRRLVSLSRHAVIGRRRVKVGVALLNNRGCGGSGVGGTALARITRAIKNIIILH
jgi:hypothetical protein